MFRGKVRAAGRDLMDKTVELDVLLVEDDPTDLRQLKRDLPEIFEAKGITVRIDGKSSFEDGLAAIRNPIIRYDLVISDTYRGAVKNRDAKVLELIGDYKKGKFCPLIVISSGECPADLNSTAFVNWVSKVDPDDLKRAIHEILDLGIPQLAKLLHEQIDSSAGSFLWNFVEQNWHMLADSSKDDPTLLDRLIRRRAALAISDLMPASYSSVGKRYGLEYYIYPALEHDYYSLGDILKGKEDEADIRVIMTPHCYLFTQEGQDKPSAEYVLTLKTVTAANVLGEKLANAKSLGEPGKLKKLKNWSNSPAQTERKPSGRHWYLPKFLEIPHLFCDFLQIESLSYDELKSRYDPVATLVPPYAEALQVCFLNFYSSVGIPNIDPSAILDMLDIPAVSTTVRKKPRSKKTAAKKKSTKTATRKAPSKKPAAKKKPTAKKAKKKASSNP